jgi:hypothetical protein
MELYYRGLGCMSIFPREEIALCVTQFRSLFPRSIQRYFPISWLENYLWMEHEIAIGIMLE